MFLRLLPPALFGSKLPLQRAQIIPELRGGARPQDGDHLPLVLPMAHPIDRHLRHRASHFLRYVLHFDDHSQGLITQLQFFGLEARWVADLLLEFPGQDAGFQQAPRENGHVPVLGHRQDGALHRPVEQRVGDLHGDKA